MYKRQLLNSVRQRLDRLNEFAPKSEIDTDAKSFAEEALEPAWNNATAELGDSAMAEGRDLSQKLPQEQRCLSPSDFGFHNALRDLNGGLCFLDFEYAGWDDPAKMVCDFFLHPGVPVPQSFFAHFYSKVTAFFSADSDLSQRIRLTYPLHRIKWCCIVLNEFLKLESERREFAGAGTDHEQVKATQLAKAKYTLARSAP